VKLDASLFDEVQDLVDLTRRAVSVREAVHGNELVLLELLLDVIDLFFNKVKKLAFVPEVSEHGLMDVLLSHLILHLKLRGLSERA